MTARGDGRSLTGVGLPLRVSLRGVCAAALVLMLLVTGAVVGAAPSGGMAETSAGVEATGGETPEAEAPALTNVDLSGVWRFKGDWEEDGLAQGWQQPEFDDSEWRSLQVPATWEEQGVLTSNPRWPGDPNRPSAEGEEGYNGYAWYRRHFSIPADWAQAVVRFRCGAIDEMDWTYVNGTLVGATTGTEAWVQARDYLLAPDVLRPGQDNVIAIRVCDTGGSGGIYGGPVEFVNVSAGEAAAAQAQVELDIEYPERRGDFVNVGGGVEVPAGMMVEGDAVAIGGPADISGYVKGNVVAVGGDIQARSGSQIDGNATAVGGRVIREEGTRIGGSTVETPIFPASLINRIVGETVEHREWGGGARLSLSAFLRNLLFWAIAAAILVLIFPRRLEVMARALPAAPGRAVACGVGGVLLTPAALVTAGAIAFMLCVVLAVTVIGIVLIPFVGVALTAAVVGLFFLALLGSAAVLLSCGKAVSAQFGRANVQALWAVLFGLLLIAVASAIPLIGRLVVVTVAILGFGVALMTGMGSDAEWCLRRLRRGRMAREESAQEPAGQSEPAEEASSTEEAERAAEGERPVSEEHSE